MSEMERVAYLQMIQSVIARLSTNSFSVKSLTVTIGAGALAVAATLSPESRAPILTASLVLLVVFWALDARILVREYSYRSLYEHVRRGDNIDPFVMDLDHRKIGMADFGRVVASWSLIWFYGPIGFLLLITLVTFELLGLKT